MSAASPTAMLRSTRVSPGCACMTANMPRIASTNNSSRDGARTRNRTSAVCSISSNTVYFAPVATGYPRRRHDSKPPYRASTLVKPLRLRMSAAPALDSSAGHVQYVTIGLFFDNDGIIVSMLASGMFIAPSMCAVSNAAAGRTSMTVTVPAFIFSRKSSTAMRGIDAFDSSPGGATETGSAGVFAGALVVVALALVALVTGAVVAIVSVVASGACVSTVRVSAQKTSPATANPPIARRASVAREEDGSC